MATDNRGRKLPKGIRQKGINSFEGRFFCEGKSYSVYGTTCTETRRAMEELRYKIEHGQFVDKERMTLGTWFDTWMEKYKKNKVKIGTYTSYQKYYKYVVKDKLGNVLLSRIRGEHIQDIYNGMAEDGYKYASIKVVSAMLGGCFKQALINGLIENNPVKAAVLPRKTDQKGHEVMTREQQALFLQYAAGNNLYNFFSLMLLTGMRNGELRGLKYSDIDKKNGVIHVQRTIKYIEGKGNIEDAPKTKTSIRDIPLRNDILELLQDQKKRNGELHWVQSIDGYFFQNWEGGPLSDACINQAIHRIVERIHKAGNEFPEISSHSFRHTFATRAIEAGMQPQTLKTILGHSSLAMTMDLYSHVLPNTKQEEMDKIASAFY